jgi:hypothetical protein
VRTVNYLDPFLTEATKYTKYALWAPVPCRRTVILIHILWQSTYTEKEIIALQGADAEEEERCMRVVEIERPDGQRRYVVIDKVQANITS